MKKLKLLKKCRIVSDLDYVYLSIPNLNEGGPAMQTKLKEILDTLNNIQENLLSLPEDMLLNIDPRDNDSLEQGSRFISAFDDNLDQFMDITTKITEQIKTHFSINPEEEELEKESGGQQRQARIIRELDKTTPHNLDENFTFKRPYGFILGNTAVKGIKTWRNLFILTLDELHGKDPSLFAKLPEEKKFISNRGKPLFARDRESLREGMGLKSGLYVEVNLSANDISKNIKTLLEYFQLDPKTMKIYLREDRDAD